MSRVRERGGERGLLGLPEDESVLVTETPASVLALRAVRRKAALHELAIGGLEAAEQPVRAPEQGARVDVARRREQGPHPPLDAVLERRLIRLRRDERVLRILALRDALDPGALAIGERGLEVVEEQLELAHPSGARERERGEQPSLRERFERGRRRELRRDGPAARGDRVVHALADRLLDADRVRGRLIFQQRDFAVEVEDRRGSAVRARQRVLLVED